MADILLKLMFADLDEEMRAANTWLNDKNSTANFVSLGLSGNIFFFHARTSFPTWT